MKKASTALLLVLGIATMNAQLYVPNGALNSTSVANGNIGIGTSNPSQKLEVSGNVRINTGSDYSHMALGQDFNDAVIADNTKTKYYGGGYWFRVHNPTVAYNYIDALMLADSGNVGIGVLNPQSRLDVAGGINLASSYPIQLNGADVSHGLKYMRVYSDNHTLLDGPFLYGFSGGSLGIKKSDAEIGILNWNDKGNVGIGTTTPSFKLDVAGNIASTLASNEGGSIVLNNPLKTAGNTARTWTIYNMTGHYGNSLQFWNYSADGTKDGSRLKISDDGNMALYGKFEAKEMKVTTSPTADFVFEEGYNLLRLEEVEKHIKEKKHLAGIASAREMEKEGVNIGEFQIKLLQKIEELTLYIIQQEKRIKELETKNLKYDYKK